jgi:hypothetical protein
MRSFLSNMMNDLQPVVEQAVGREEEKSED